MPNQFLQILKLPASPISLREKKLNASPIQKLLIVVNGKILITYGVLARKDAVGHTVNVFGMVSPSAVYLQ